MLGLGILDYVKIGGALALVIALTVGYFIVKGWHDDALKLPQVQAALDHANKQGDDIEKRLIYIDGERVSAETAISAWQNFAPAVLSGLKKAMANANISKNP